MIITGDTQSSNRWWHCWYISPYPTPGTLTIAGNSVTLILNGFMQCLNFFMNQHLSVSNPKSQTASRWVQPCLRGSWSCPTDRQTDRQTDYTLREDICSNGPHLAYLRWQIDNHKQSQNTTIWRPIATAGDRNNWMRVSHTAWALATVGGAAMKLLREPERTTFQLSFSSPVSSP